MSHAALSFNYLDRAHRKPARNFTQSVSLPFQSAALFSYDAPDDLSLMLMESCELFYEYAPDQPLHFHANRTLAHHQFTLSITTASAYEQFPARYIARALRKKLMLNHDAFYHIETALHEAIINAVIHGNLGIEGNFKDYSEFETHQEKVRTLLENTTIANKRIIIQCGWDKDLVNISVSDHGNGFCEANNPPSSTHKGRSLIAKCSHRHHYSDDGKTLEMQFLRGSGSTQFSFSEQLKDALILIVDDNQFNRTMIEKILSSNGFTRLITATNGKEALDITREQHPDIVVLDLIMPEMDGFEYCQTIREDVRYKDTAIIIQTSLDNAEERNRVFEIGATDLLMKPIHPDELTSRIQVHYERILSSRILNHYRQRISEEMLLARDMQFALLPSANVMDDINDRYPIMLDSYFEPSTEIGGDIWGVHPINDDQIAVYTCDFAGHGITAAINTFRMHSSMLVMQEVTEDPSAYLSMLNDTLKQMLSVGHFATFFYGIIDVKQNTLRYAAAGSPPPILYNGNTKESMSLDTKGVPLGVAKNITYETHEAPFSAGDTLCLYSDALIETAIDQEGTFIDESMIGNIIHNVREKHSDMPHKTTMRELLRPLYAIDKVNLDDDLTICLLTRT